ncbi:hypothetical protein HOY82DRAFT_600299 [Tuber indicum]|nr:hypothetical protein HOY82DRAFT_600299 [Tuber indicum]
MTGNHYDEISKRPTPTGGSSPSPPTDTGPSPLVCPVSTCPLVFDGETSHLDFCRHLNHPDLHERAEYEKAAASRHGFTRLSGIASSMLKTRN